MRPSLDCKIEVYDRQPRDDQVAASQYVERDIPADYVDGPTLVGAFVDAILTGGEASPDFADGLRIAHELDMIHAAAARRERA